MDETTIKVLAFTEARMEVMMASLSVALTAGLHPDEVVDQWMDLVHKVPFQIFLKAAENGAKQMRVLAEYYETDDQEREKELAKEWAAMNQMMRLGMADLWPDRPQE